MTERDFHWLVGLLEGEGSFMHGPPSAPYQPRIAVQMTDQDVVARVAALFGVGYMHHQVRRTHRQHKPTYATVLRGSNAVALMRQVLPYMSKRRQARIQEILEKHATKPPLEKPRLTAEQVLAIRLDENHSISALARQYNISRAHVRRIKAGFTSSTAHAKYKAAAKPE